MGDAHDLENPFVYSYKISFPKYLSLKQPGTFTAPIGIPSQSGISNLAASMVMEKREFPIPCVSARREETTVITIPESISISALPEPKRIKHSYGQYLATYTAEGNTVTIERSLDLELPALCDSETYTALRNLAVAIALDLREPISYTQRKI